MRWLAHQEVAHLVNRDALLARMLVVIRLLAQQRQKILDPLDGFDKLVSVDFVHFELVAHLKLLQLFVDRA